MMNLVEKFNCLENLVGGNHRDLKQGTRVGGNLGAKVILPASRPVIRILAEMDYAMQLSQENGGKYDTYVEAAIDYLTEAAREQGALTNQNCEAAEEMLLPLQDAAKEYEIILAGHAHIDMNWQWGYDETVAITLATFRSVLNLMDQYPDFCFSQSQASVYKIVEDHDPAMMEQIKARIAEGRWEVTASYWVETDKNLPSGESMLRHIEYSREYLTNVWGVKRLDVDFSPDTFGHSANIAEINSYGDVKYYYHCRGSNTGSDLYRYRALSGKEILVRRETLWYTGAITPFVGPLVFDISKRTCGLKTILHVYGVGDHGGGPTRRDVERALDMMTWKIYPRVRFGTFHEYFDEAAKIWDQIPVVSGEINYIFTGCYSTLSCIKRGNRRLEAALADAEIMSAAAGQYVGYPFAEKQLKDAWKNVLFGQFHDILPGTATQPSKEYIMGQYQVSKAISNTQISNAMYNIALNIDTSSIPVDIDAYVSQSEGAGVGFGLENFIGVPSTERGSGKTRIFHIFNTMPMDRKETAELTVWDWIGDMGRIQVKDHKGNPLPFQLLNIPYTGYYGHSFFKILVEADVPAMGYTTVVLSEKDVREYPVNIGGLMAPRVESVYTDPILENDRLKVRIDKNSGRIVSLFDKEAGMEMIADGTGAGFTYIETERVDMSAWNIGRYLSESPLTKCVELSTVDNGGLRQSVRTVYNVGESRIDAVYSLDKDACAVKVTIKAHWQEHGLHKDHLPMLNYRVPVAYETKEFLYDIPAGAVRRSEAEHDVPALQYGMALGGDKDNCAILISDSKYGYRGTQNSLSLTLFHCAIEPDPYPERGEHDIVLWLGTCPAQAKKAEEMALVCNHALLYQPSNCHTGSLPMESSLLKAVSDNAVISAVLPRGNGGMLVRGYETNGCDGQICLTFGKKVAKAAIVDLAGNELAQKAEVNGETVVLPVSANSIAAVEVYFAE
ncbi:MAG: alpha-mannosidase [Clostridia bacterium]|nr:alpha-mannosidase [Clostridia bacterium]